MGRFTYYPATPGGDIGNMAMIQGKFMPSNPQFVGAGANKKFNPYIQGKFMPSNPDFIGVGAYRPESNIYSGLPGFEGRNDAKNFYGDVNKYGLSDDQYQHHYL